MHRVCEKQGGGKRFQIAVPTVPIVSVSGKGGNGRSEMIESTLGQIDAQAKRSNIGVDVSQRVPVVLQHALVKFQHD